MNDNAKLGVDVRALGRAGAEACSVDDRRARMSVQETLKTGVGMHEWSSWRG